MNLYSFARLMNTLTHPTPTRAKNIIVGRSLARAGIFRRLWGRW